LGGLSSVATNLGLNSLGQPVSSFAAMSPMTAGGAGLYQVLGQDFQATLRAIAQAGKVSVLSRPSILARNNQPAQIFVGQMIPIPNSVSYAALTTTPIIAYTYTQVGVILNVTPFITKDGMVEMIVAPQISSLDPTLTEPIAQGVNAAVIDQRSASTVVVTPDSQTVVIGGLMENDKSQQETKIPVLSSIPLLGNLFKHKTTSNAKTELIIFLTPHIVQAPSQLAALSARETAKSPAAKSFPEQELNQFIEKLPPGSLPNTTPTSPARQKSGTSK
jgi:general secretion pathway protein D